MYEMNIKRILLNYSKEDLRLYCVDNGIEYGVQFIRKDDEAREELKNLIEDIKEREDRLSRIVGIGGRTFQSN